MSTQLPPIGRGTITLRRLYGSQNKGDTFVGASETFLAGMVAKRHLNSNGFVELAVCDGSAYQPCGLFGNHKVTSFYQPVVDEAITFTSGGATATLKHANVSNVKVTNKAGSGATAYTVTTDYTVATTNGIITRVNSGALGPNASTTKTAYVSYRYEDTTIAGIDETMGSAKVTLWEGEGEFTTLVYDTGSVYNLDSKLYCSTAGLLTTTTTGTVVVGRVTQAPSASDASLRFVLYSNL